MDEQTWDTLSGKPIDLQQLLRWGLQHSTANEDRTQASSEATKHEPVVRVDRNLKDLPSSNRTRNGSRLSWENQI